MAYRTENEDVIDQIGQLCIILLWIICQWVHLELLQSHDLPMPAGHGHCALDGAAKHALQNEITHIYAQTSVSQVALHGSGRDSARPTFFGED